MSKFEPNPPRRGTIVTGASSGIGLATAQLIAAQGHPVVLGARRIDELKSAAQVINDAGGEAYGVHLDLADPASPTRFVAEATEVLGSIEILVSNAALNQVGAVLDMSPADLAGMLEVNLAGTHRLLQEVLPGMVERQRGDLVMVTSDVVAAPRPSMAAYVTSKWGLEGYSRALQMELEGTGVRASVLRPGPTLTGMGMDWDPDLTAQVLEQWGAWGFTRHSNFMRPKDVAEAIVAVVGLPRGIQVSTIELHPEAPITPRADA